MRSNNFLQKIKKEGKLELIEPNKDISNSYLSKSDDCFKSAKLLFNNKLYENSVAMSYYSMYNALIALLFKIGIKCENHSASILLLKLLFKKEELFKMISRAKKERIDKQYYVTTEDNSVTDQDAKNLLDSAEKFVLKIKLLIKKLNNKEIENIYTDFNNIIN